MDQAQELRKLSESKQGRTTIYTVPYKTRIIAITSGKGGVGKTTISVNLAIAMAKAGKKVLVFDGDLGLANINVLLGIIPKHTLYHVIKGQKSLEEIIIHTREGIDIVPGANGYTQLADLDIPERNNLLKQFSALDDYEIILVDTGAGIGGNVMSLLVASHELLVITTPDPTSITDAYGLIKSVLTYDRKKPIRLLINRAKTSEEGRKVAERIINITSKFLSTQIKALGMVYVDDEVEQSTRKQKPFLLTAPSSIASECITNISNHILDIEDESEPENSSVLDFFKQFFWFLDKGKNPRNNILEED